MFDSCDCMWFNKTSWIFIVFIFKIYFQHSVKCHESKCHKISKLITIKIWLNLRRTSSNIFSICRILLCAFKPDKAESNQSLRQSHPPTNHVRRKIFNFERSKTCCFCCWLKFVKRFLFINSIRSITCKQFVVVRHSVSAPRCKVVFFVGF